MSDVEEELSIEIDDELLISLVQASPYLYAKNDKNFKNNKLKDMKWEVIAETLNCTVIEAKKRWESLRNQFCRKLRQQKSQPSGSGTLTEWPLMSCMSFLTPHIQNRKTRSSSLLKSTSICNERETSSNSSINSPVLSPTAACAIQSLNTISCTDSEYTISCTDSEYSTWNDNDHRESQNIENTETILTENNLSEVSTKETLNIAKTSTIHKKRKLVPPLDKFAQKKKACNERLEDILTKSSQAVTDLAVAYKSGKVEEKENISDPNANVIAQALKSVAAENQLSCLIAVLQLIESFQH